MATHAAPIEEGSRAAGDPALIGPVTDEDWTEEQALLARKFAEQNQRTWEAFETLEIPHPVGRVFWVHIDRVQANDWNPNSVAHHEMNLLYTSISEDGYCVQADTPVLRADLRWVPAGSLQPGDKIVAFDEERPGAGKGNKLGRKFRTATVMANSLEESELVRVVTEQGEVLTTPDHPWLANSNYGDASLRTMKWIDSADLKPGDDVRFFSQPWEEDRTWEGGWLSGFLDGEGCISRSASSRQKSMRLSGSQKPSETADMMIKLMSKYGDPIVKTLDRSRFENQQDNVQCVFNKAADIMRVLGSVRPQRLLTNAGEFWDGLSMMKAFSRAKVLKVEPVDRGIIARLSTSTGTFIGAGFAMHNTMPVVTIWDPAAGSTPAHLGRFVIVDGFHRYTTMKRYADIAATTGGYLPLVVLHKSVADRMASTVRHNRARGAHSVAGMSSLVFDMLKEGESDTTICQKLGLEGEELVRLKHITGYSKLFKDHQYSKQPMTENQMNAKRDYKREHPEEMVPTW